MRHQKWTWGPWPAKSSNRCEEEEAAVEEDGLGRSLESSGSVVKVVVVVGVVVSFIDWPVLVISLCLCVLTVGRCEVLWNCRSALLLSWDMRNFSLRRRLLLLNFCSSKSCAISVSWFACQWRFISWPFYKSTNVIISYKYTKLLLLYRFYCEIFCRGRHLHTYEINYRLS